MEERLEKIGIICLVIAGIIFTTSIMTGTVIIVLHGIYSEPPLWWIYYACSCVPVVAFALLLFMASFAIKIFEE